MDLWQLLRDILLTGTGIGLLLSQVISARPSDAILVAGLALTAPSVAGHAGALLAGPRHGTGHGSPEPPSSGPPSSSSSPPGDTGDH